MEEWYKEVGQLQSQVATIPQQTQVKESVAGRQAAVEARMVRLIEPLKERRRLLLASKEVHQVRRDLEDEIVGLVGIHFLLFPPCEQVRLQLNMLLSFFSYGFRSASRWPCVKSTARLFRKCSSK